MSIRSAARKLPPNMPVVPVEELLQLTSRVLLAGRVVRLHYIQPLRVGDQVLGARVCLIGDGTHVVSIWFRGFLGVSRLDRERCNWSVTDVTFLPTSRPEVDEPFDLALSRSSLIIME